MTLEERGNSTINVLSHYEQLGVFEDSKQWEAEHFSPPRVGGALGGCALTPSEVQTNLCKWQFQQNGLALNEKNHREITKKLSVYAGVTLRRSGYIKMLGFISFSLKMQPL